MNPTSFPSQDAEPIGSAAVRQVQTRVRLRIPKQYQHEPILSNLITRHHLTVNVTAALLSHNSCDDGWFDVELQGTPAQLDEAFLYLNDLTVEIWRETDPTEENW